MNLNTIACLLACLLIFSKAFCQNSILVNIPSAQAEAEYIWRTIQDTKFFEEHHYQVSLPKGILIDKLKQKAKSGKLTNEDYLALKQFVIDQVYHKIAYQKGYEKIQQQIALLNNMINTLRETTFDWDFKHFETYTINLTLYGPGGSYNADEGSILIFTTTDGRFKSYENPANTIIHEIVHIGIEKAIIKMYNVPHPLKERIVDTFVCLNFGQYLPTYKIQDMGEKRTDQHLQKVNDLKSLDQIVAKVLK